MKKFLLLFAICLIALPLMGSSCVQPVDKITGGGFIPAKGDCGKANFGFNIQFTYEDSKPMPCISGQFQYDDKVAIQNWIPVRFHGEFDDWSLGVGRVYFAQGTYRTEPPVFKDGEICTGRFCVTVVDNGQPNDGGKDDYIKVEITSGPLKGYRHDGYLQGGNIVVHYVQ